MPRKLKKQNRTKTNQTNTLSHWQLTKEGRNVISGWSPSQVGGPGLDLAEKTAGSWACGALSPERLQAVSWPHSWGCRYLGGWGKLFTCWGDRVAPTCNCCFSLCHWRWESTFCHFRHFVHIVSVLRLYLRPFCISSGRAPHPNWFQQKRGNYSAHLTEQFWSWFSKACLLPEWVMGWESISWLFSSSVIDSVFAGSSPVVTSWL